MKPAGVNADPATLKILLGVQELDRQLDRLAHDRDTLPELASIAEIDEPPGRRSMPRRPRSRRGVTSSPASRSATRTRWRCVDERIATEDAKLYSGAVTALKELQALQDEIAGLTARRTVVEDQILEIMEAIEPVDAELAVIEHRRGELTAERRRRSRHAVEARRAEIDAEADAVRTRRGADAADLGDELVAEYERLRARPGQVGVARLVGTTCHGCHLDLAAVEVDRLKKLPANDLVHCDECGCILVR